MEFTCATAFEGYEIWVGVIRDVLKGMPKLHMMKLLSCTGVCNIIAKGLNTLIVIGHMIALLELEIMAPNLESLIWSRNF